MSLHNSESNTCYIQIVSPYPSYKIKFRAWHCLCLLAVYILHFLRFHSPHKIYSHRFLTVTGWRQHSGKITTNLALQQQLGWCCYGIPLLLICSPEGWSRARNITVISVFSWSPVWTHGLTGSDMILVWCECEERAQIGAEHSSGHWTLG